MPGESGDLEPPNVVSNDDKNGLKYISSFNLQNKYTSKNSGPYFVSVEHIKRKFDRFFPMKIGYFSMMKHSKQTNKI